MTTTRSYVLGCLEDAKKKKHGATRDDARNEPKRRASASATPPPGRASRSRTRRGVCSSRLSTTRRARARCRRLGDARAVERRSEGDARAASLEETDCAAPRVDDGAAATSRGERNRHVTHAVLRRRIHENRTSPPTSPSSARSALPSRAPADGAREARRRKSRVGRLRRGRRPERRRERVPEAFSGILFDRDETRPRDGMATAVGGSAASARVARTLAALAPEIQLETSFAETGRFFRPEAFSKNERSFVREGAFGEAREPSDAVGSAKTTRPSRPGVVRHIARIVGAVEIRDETKNEKTAKRERLRLAVLVAAESAFERPAHAPLDPRRDPGGTGWGRREKTRVLPDGRRRGEAHARGLSFRGRLGVVTSARLGRTSARSRRAVGSTPLRSSPTPTTTL